jgi:hypothetical protein
VPVAENQFEYNGLTFGAGTAFGVKNVSGLSPGPRKLDEVPKPQGDGSWSHRGGRKAKHIVITGQCIGSTGSVWSDLRSNLDAAFDGDGDQDIPLFYNFGDGEESVDCKAVDLEYELDVMFASRGFVARWMVELLASDPTLSGGGAS